MALVTAGKERTRCPITNLIFTFFWQCSFMYGVQIDEASVAFVVAQSPIHVRFFTTLWTAAHQASLSFTISWSLPKFMSIASVMPSDQPSHPQLIFFCPHSFPAWGTFPVSQLFTSDDRNTRASASASVLPTSIQGWSPWRLTGWSPCCPGEFQESSPTPQFKGTTSLAFCLFYCPALTTVHDH